MDAIRAIIDAAYIQGFLGFLGPIVGAVALIVSIRIAAKNTLNEIKLEKVAESKRDQYISLTETYTQYLVSSLTLKTKASMPDGSADLDFNNSWNQHLTRYIELLGCINKVNLISTSEIRLELFQLEKKLTNYQASIANYYFNSHPPEPSKDLENSVFAFAKLIRIDLGVENNDEIERNLLELRKHKE